MLIAGQFELSDIFEESLPDFIPAGSLPWKEKKASVRS